MNVYRQYHETEPESTKYRHFSIALIICQLFLSSNASRHSTIEADHVFPKGWTI
jgi:hypothetical protein